MKHNNVSLPSAVGEIQLLEYLKITLVIRHDHHSSIWNMIYLIWFHQPPSMRVHDVPTWALRMSVVLEIVIKFLWPKVCMIRRSIFHHYFNGIWCICIWVRGFTGFWSHSMYYVSFDWQCFTCSGSIVSSWLIGEQCVKK